MTEFIRNLQGNILQLGVLEFGF